MAWMKFVELKKIKDGKKFKIVNRKSAPTYTMERKEGKMIVITSDRSQRTYRYDRNFPVYPL